MLDCFGGVGVEDVGGHFGGVGVEGVGLFWRGGSEWWVVVLAGWDASEWWGVVL